MTQQTVDQSVTDYLGFLQEYNAFLAEMSKSEQEKLQALLSNSLPRIEHALSEMQANAKRMENMEAKRLNLQKKAGLGDLSFSQIIEALPEELRAETAALMHNFERHISDIRFHNEKSMSIAHDRVMIIDPDALQDKGEQPSTAAESAYAKVRDLLNNNGILETKI